MVILTFRPIKVWPDGWRDPSRDRPCSPFRATYTDTLNLLERELGHLDATDVTLQVDVEPGGAWRWRGMRNNQGLGTIRTPGGNHPEVSVVRYLAEAFGLIGPDDHGCLYPTAGDTNDVNPWHRTLRRTAGPGPRPSNWPGRRPPPPER